MSDLTLDELIKIARDHTLTTAEIRAQKVSFIRGMGGELTDDEIRRIAGMPSVEEERILAGLRDGSLVAAPRESARAAEQIAIGLLRENERLRRAVGLNADWTTAPTHLLKKHAAAQEPGHD